MKKIVIDKTNSNERVDKYIKRYLNNAPLSFIYKTFRKKDIKVNKKPVKQDYILKENDILEIYIKDEIIDEFKRKVDIKKIKYDLDIVYEDDNILIINKEKGILVQEDKNESINTLTNMVRSYLIEKENYIFEELSFNPSPCHRLDRNTSGLIIYAKNHMSSQIMMNLLKDKRNIEKHYIALVKGKTETKGIIDVPLRKDENKSYVRVDTISNGAKKAVTKYKVIKQTNDYSLLDIVLETGRTHQIRVHFAYINHPLIGDSKYGDFELNKEFKSLYKYDSQFLHAYSIKFKNVDGILSYLSNKEFVAKLNKKEENILQTLNLE